MVFRDEELPPEPLGGVGGAVSAGLGDLLQCLLVLERRRHLGGLRDLVSKGRGGKQHSGEAERLETCCLCVSSAECGAGRRSQSRAPCSVGTGWEGRLGVTAESRGCFSSSGLRLFTP